MSNPENLGAQIGDVVMVFRPSEDISPIRLQELIKAALKDTGLLADNRKDNERRADSKAMEDFVASELDKPTLAAVGRLGRSGWNKGSTK